MFSYKSISKFSRYKDNSYKIKVDNNNNNINNQNNANGNIINIQNNDNENIIKDNQNNQNNQLPNYYLTCYIQNNANESSNYDLRIFPQPKSQVFGDYVTKLSNIVNYVVEKPSDLVYYKLLFRMIIL